MHISRKLWNIRKSLATRYPFLFFLSGRHQGLRFDDDSWHLAEPKNYSIASGLSKSRTIFLHIPKSGGTTLDLIINACCEYSGLKYQRYMQPGSTKNLIHQNWRGAWSEIEQQSPEERESISFAAGHFPFGVHELFPGHSQYITLVRNPADREISSFNYMYQHGFIDKDRSILSMMANGECIDNPQVRIIAGAQSLTGKCDGTTFELALANIKNYFFKVGVVDYETSFIDQLLADYGWPAVVYGHNNITKFKLIKNPDDGLKERLSDYHKYDLKLYELIKMQWSSLYSPQINPDRDPPNLPKEALMITRDFRKNRSLKMLDAREISSLIK